MAQALTLKESFERHNPSCDFFIFLADKVTEEVANLSLVQLDESWIPKWREMAFKYDVIEFNTSIKPFCINKLFMDGYDKVIYLDPDIYVFDSLEIIWTWLDTKSIVLTPHYCSFNQSSERFVKENTVSNVGVFNLGFVAISSTEVGRQAVQWWMNRLESECYIDYTQGLFVDQKWMDFMPGYFPNDVKISHHVGLNVAIWNIHERKIVFEGDKRYVLCEDLSRKDPLIFFHFSSYSPYKPSLLNKAETACNTETYPELEPLITEYREAELRNGYERYSKMEYAYNCFDNGLPILPIHRRLFRASSSLQGRSHNPFDSADVVYKTLSANRLCIKHKSNVSQAMTTTQKARAKTKLNRFFAVIFRLLGVSNYQKLLTLARYYSRLENNLFIIDE